MLVPDDVLKCFLQIVLVIVMLSVGSSTERSHCLRILSQPLCARRSELLALFTTLFGLFTIMPLAAYLLTAWSELSPAVRMGLFLASFSPGGLASSVLSLRCGSNSKLNTMTTSLASVLVVPFLPLLVVVVLDVEEAEAIDYKSFLVPLALIFLPLLVGKLVQLRFKFVYDRAHDFVNLMGSFLILLIAIQSGPPTPSWELITALVALAFVGFGVGGILGLLIGADAETLMAMSLELTMHDVTIPATTLISVFGEFEGIIEGVQTVMLFGWVQLSLGLVLSATFLLWRHCSSQGVGETEVSTQVAVVLPDPDGVDASHVPNQSPILLGSRPRDWSKKPADAPSPRSTSIGSGRGHLSEVSWKCDEEVVSV